MKNKPHAAEIAILAWPALLPVPCRYCYLSPNKGSNTIRKINEKGDDFADDLNRKFDQFLKIITQKIDQVLKDISTIAERK